MAFDPLERPGLHDRGVLVDRDVVVEIKRIKTEIDSIAESDPAYQEGIEKVREKTEMVTVVLNELLSKDRSIRNRISQVQLDTLLHTALLDRGIDTEASYAVIDASADSLVLSNHPDAAGALKQSEFRTRLFTRDVISHANVLAVYFPNQRSFLMSKVWFTLASSALLVAIIVLSFAYAIHTIVRQKKLSEVKNDFINNMTHEFKTPISTVSLACEALQDEDVKKNEHFLKRYLSIIQAENNRLAMQVEKVLQMATLERKEFKLKPEQLDVHEVIERALHNVTLQIEKRQGQITKRLSASRSDVVADELHLTNIIYNLLDNANKYSPEPPRVVIETENDRQGIKVRISDEGIGMTKEATAKIFDKFYRVPTGNIHNVKGFGLGLAYVKTMLQAQGGSISVHSAPGRGSTFELYLPQNGKS